MKCNTLEVYVFSTPSPARQSLTVAFNADATADHAFGIFMAYRGALRTFGAPAPVNAGQ